MNQTIKVKVMDDDYISITKGITLAELSKNYSHKFKYDILLAKVNNELFDLQKTLNRDCNIEFLDLTNSNGFRTYQRSISFLMIYAIKLILGNDARVIVEHSTNKNYYCEIIKDDFELTEEIIKEIENKMKELVKEDLPIEKVTLDIEKAIEIAKNLNMKDKVVNFKFRRTSTVNFYKLNDFYDYFYGQLVNTTGILKRFALTKVINGLLLQFPKSDNPEEIREPIVYEKISKVFIESSQWARILNIDTVGVLNEGICGGNLGNIIRINEALHEKRIASIADMIHQGNKKIVLVAGPSSSGKTTFSHRLNIQLRVNGIRANVISMDDYFLDLSRRERINGEADLESINAVNIELLNKHLTQLLKGETVNVPWFNFATGKSEDKGKLLTLKENSVLIIEGIHGLNEKVAKSISKEDKFKVFISALTQLNVDDHNRIPTTDTRMLRRIVRDNQFRKLNAVETIKMWPSVLEGEMINIFPYQEEADTIFNSALVYELAVIKSYVEPILFDIQNNLPEYTEARRLIKFLDSFLAVSSEEVPNNSLLREFIGGSCF